MNKSPKLTVVGAGPGDPDLITLKGVKALELADVVLYDALVNKTLLKYAPKSAELIYVGKRPGCYAYQQHQINELIVDSAIKKGHVVRLKGGDPFIFGRGAEELEYAKRFGVEGYLVSGVSSAISVPANQGISLTKRGVSESFWVVTATTKAHKMSEDIRWAAKSSATIIILMGMNKLKEIVDIFYKENKKHVAVAIIQEGTTQNEKMEIGSIETIYDIALKKNLTSPAIIIVGEVVRQRTQILKIVKNITTQ